MADDKKAPNNVGSPEKGEKSKGNKGKKKGKNRGQNAVADPCCESNTCDDSQVAGANANAQQLERDQLVKLKKVFIQLWKSMLGENLFLGTGVHCSLILTLS